jgi:3-hydroxyisobutyrate dehydrogenase-like beta-hydroxyacid dehydrogenase
MADVRRVGILSPGDMGSGIGRVLHGHGMDVLTCLEGRSALTRKRAGEAGFRDVSSIDDLVRESDMLLSVLVPSEAVPTADAVAAAMRRTGATPVYVECNAVAPQTVLNIERTIRGAGASFIDAGIIGGPPRMDYSPNFEASGPDTAPLETLRNYGINVKVVGPKVGQASGLKMMYAASTKGTTALWTEIMVAARALGLEEALREEWGPNNGTAKGQMNGIPGMPHRARRWVGEMEEIAATFAGVGLTPKILEGAADIYRFVASTPLADQTSREPNPTLDHLLDVLASQLGE